MVNSAALRRSTSLLAGATAAVLAAGLLSGPASAAAAVSSVTINDPGTPVAGPVQLTGTVTAGTLTTTVLYAIDVSQSTQHPDRQDCNGDGVFSPGKDNLNGDNSTGDVLDCEIGAVQALNRTLAASAGKSVVALQRFNTSSVSVPLNGTTFVAPGTTNAGGNVLEQAAAGSQRATDPGTNFNTAIATALNTLKSAPAGPRWIVMLSDGKSDKAGLPSQGTLDALKASGVKVRTFSPSGTVCADSLKAMSAVTGQSCIVRDPSKLSNALSTTQPDSVASVRVTIAGKTFATSIDLAGGWKADLTLGAGTYPTHVVATLSSGSTVSADRTFTVAPAPAGTPAPAPGAVAGTPGTASGTPISAGAVGVRLPRPVLTNLPGRVSGRVGTRGSTAAPVPADLDGATVLLQGRGPRVGWRNLARTQVSGGAYTLSWRPKAKFKRLRVRLLPYRNVTGAMRAVPKPVISSCVRRGGSQWRMVCKTTAANGKKVRLLKSGRLVARTKVVRHRVSVSGSGNLRRYVVIIDVSRRAHPRLRL